LGSFSISCNQIVATKRPSVTATQHRQFLFEARRSAIHSVQRWMKPASASLAGLRSVRKAYLSLASSKASAGKATRIFQSLVVSSLS
jgi:hypothetical protein